MHLRNHSGNQAKSSNSNRWIRFIQKLFKGVNYISIPIMVRSLRSRATNIEVSKKNLNRPPRALLSCLMPSTTILRQRDVKCIFDLLFVSLLWYKKSFSMPLI